MFFWFVFLAGEFFLYGYLDGKLYAHFKYWYCQIALRKGHINLFIFYNIYLAAPGLSCCTQDLCCRVWDLSCGMCVRSSSLTRDRTRAPCIGSVESYPLDHQGSPHMQVLKREGKACMLAPPCPPPSLRSRSGSCLSLTPSLLCSKGSHALPFVLFSFFSKVIFHKHLYP